MEIRQMEYILTIAKSNFSLTHAADTLNISQPALSKMLSGIEAELDIKIFLRNKGRLIGLTPAGDILLSHARALVADYYKMMDKLIYYSRQMTGRVRIGIPSSILKVLFSKTLPNIILNHPSILFEIIELEAIRLEKKFLNGEIDILITLEHNQMRQEHCEVTRLVSEPYVAIMDMNHPLMGHEALDWTQFEGISLALPPQSYTNILVIESLEEVGVMAQVVISTTSSEVLIQSVVGTEVVTILPKVFYDAVVRGNEAISWRPLKKPIFWNVVMKTHDIHVQLKDPILHIYNCLKEY